MSKREKILSNIAFILNIIPFILVVLFVKIIPVDIEFIEGKSVYDPLLVGFLCAIPLAIIVAINFLKKNRKVQRDMTAALSVCCLLSILFTYIVILGIMAQVEVIQEILSDDDYWLTVDAWGVVSVLLCLGLALVGGSLSRKTQNSIVALKIKYTKMSQLIFDKVHSFGSQITVVGFSFMAIVLSFFGGWLTIIVPVAGVICFLVWAYLYSYMLYKKKQKKAKQFSCDGE